MSQIKRKDTDPELIVRSFLHKNGFRFRVDQKVCKDCGKSDIVLRKYNTVINVHGCFFHAHIGCRDFKIPQSNTEYWTNRFRENRERDLKNKKALTDQGWNVITIWECELKPKVREERLNELISELNTSGRKSLL